MRTPNERESAILKFWQENNIFQKSLDKGGIPYRYYDGPPYATGLPHFGHILPTTVKDLIPRYKTMRGYHVPRTWGWDCHGLPIENLVEKALNFKGKKDIESYGVGRFNEAARNSVFGFRDDWKKIVPRLGRWVDMDKDYRSMDATFMESGLWAFRKLWDKGLVYEGYKVMPWCPHCETALSNFEVTEGYEEIADLSAYVKFTIESDGEFKGAHMIAWTTTPWTLPGNTALAVNPDLVYSLVASTSTEGATEHVIILKSALEKVEALVKDKQTLVVEKDIQGTELIGLSYTAPFSYFPKEKNMHMVWGAVFVTDTDGTGIVHIAPAFGDDDMKLAQANDIPVIKHVTPTGEFVSEVTDLHGQVKPKGDHQKADIEVIKYLAHNNLLLAKEKYTHSYPHCWRCKTPLLNYATSSWFIKTTAIKDRMIEENNKTIWHPDEIGHKRLQAWLDNVRDWNVSRSRFWGTPLPVWRGSVSGKTVCLGSRDQIKEKTRRNTYTVIRHGEAQHLIENVMSSSDAVSDKHPLTEKGVAEVHASVEQLIKDGNIPTVIYYSPIRRTRETAELIKKAVEAHTKKDVVFLSDVRLREQNFGDIDGHPRVDLEPYRKTQYDTLFTKVPGGESIEDIRLRVGEFLYEIDGIHKDENILIVTHEGVAYSAQNVAWGDSKRVLEQRAYDPATHLPTAQYRSLNFANIPHDAEYHLDFHRPYVDEITFDEGEETYVRCPEVLDVWYDAGSMPFASIHYPFEKGDDQKKPEDFVVDMVAEGLDQTRGWFYHMLIMSVALFDQSPFKHVLVNGLILATDGKKMSKSLKNYPDLLPVAEQFGADSLRYFLVSSPAVRAEETAFSEKGLQEVNNKLINKILNTVSLVEMYGVKHVSPQVHVEQPLDIWIFGMLKQLVQDTTMSLDEYQIDKAARPIMDFVEELSTWYVRRSRDRFKDEHESKVITENLLYILLTVSKLLAPFTPFLSEDAYQSIKGMTSDTLLESIHLDSWPDMSDVHIPQYQEVVEKMKHTRHVVELGLAERNKEGLKVRQPLASVTVAAEVYNTLYIDIIKDELNVKEVKKGEAQEALHLDTVITEELRLEGVVRDITRDIQAERKNLDLVPEDKVEVVVYTDEVGIEGLLEDIKHTVGAVNISLKKVEAKADTKIEVKKV